MKNNEKLLLSILMVEKSIIYKKGKLKFKNSN